MTVWRTYVQSLARDHGRKLPGKFGCGPYNLPCGIFKSKTVIHRTLQDLMDRDTFDLQEFSCSLGIILLSKTFYPNRSIDLWLDSLGSMSAHECLVGGTYHTYLQCNFSPHQKKLHSPPTNVHVDIDKRNKNVGATKSGKSFNRTQQLAS
jgi:hypothetical protein